MSRAPVAMTSSSTLSDLSVELSKLERLVPLMTHQERALLARILPRRPRALWSPLSGPQALGYESPADVLGYGGAAGGGKSDVLLGLAGTRHQRSVIFRREATQGRGMIDRAREIFGTLGRFNAKDGVWTGLPGGRQIEFAGVKDPGDEQKWRGRPHDFIGFDEGDQFLEYQFRFLCGWLRTTVEGQRTRVVITFNPPATSEGRWLLRYFGPWIDEKHEKYPTPAGALRWYATLPDGKEIERPDGTPFVAQRLDGTSELVEPKSRTFIPARLTDNLFLMRTGYRSQLQAMPEPLRSQLLYGDMTAGLEDAAWQLIPTAWVKAAMDRWKPDGRPAIAQTVVGVDVARGGADKTVLARRWGKWFAPLEKHAGRDTPTGPAVAALVDKVLPEGGYAAIDAEGIGASAFDSTRGHKMAVRFGVAAKDASGEPLKDRAKVLTFLNLRAYSYWALRDALDPEKGDGLMLPPDPELLGDLTAPRYEPRSSGIKVEDKEEIRKRIGRSPDCGDAVALAFSSPVNFALPVGVSVGGSASRESNEFGL